MKFPLLNVSEKRWKGEDLMEYICFDEYIYTDDERLFNRYLRDQLFCDCNGDLYKVARKIRPTSWWRKTFRFLPTVYKIRLVFKSTGESMHLEVLRAYVIARIKDLSQDEYTVKWIEYVKGARSHEEIINSEGE